MNERERFRETLLFGKPDKISFMPGNPRESTLERWHEEGLPEGRNYLQAVREILGIKYEKSSAAAVGLDVSFKMLPQFQEKILKHEDGHYIVQDSVGEIVEISDKYDLTYLRYAKDFVTRKYHRFPVENEKEWQEMKLRYNPDAPGRYPADFLKRCEILGKRDYIFSININGPFWQMREWCGFENLCILMIDNPRFVRDMSEFWRDFIFNTMAPVLKNVEVDHVFIGEDMAYKEHSMISPEMVREYLFPCYDTWIPALKKNNPLVVIEVDSDGHIGELLQLWIEAGFNCCSPVEAAAGNDIVEYRKKYGKKMAYRGGIDKRAIAKGGETIKREIMRVVPPLLNEGGFIPSCDHGVPPDISWQGFIDYCKILAELTGWL